MPCRSCTQSKRAATIGAAHRRANRGVFNLQKGPQEKRTAARMSEMS
jgi:hypothetical protein